MNDSPRPAFPVGTDLTGIVVLNRRVLLKRAGLGAVGAVGGAAALNAASPWLLPESPVIDANHSYWSDTLAPAGAPLSRSARADVAIIGGGLTGLAAAYHLRRALPGSRIVLLEARCCGNGASARNGGMLLTSTADRWLKAAPDAALDQRIYTATADNINAIAGLAMEHGLDIGLERAGAALVLVEDAEVPGARAIARVLAARGQPVEFWDRDGVREHLGTAAYAGALLDRSSGQVHPGRLVGLFRTAALRAGVEIYERTPVSAVAAGAVHRLSTAGGAVVEAPVLVVAANAYASKIGFLRRAYAPIISYVGITAALAPHVLERLGWRSRIPFSDSRKATYYYGLGRDGRLRIGGGPPGYGFNDREPPAIVPAAQLRALGLELERVFPQLAPVHFERSWCGAVDCSLDFTPAVGRLTAHPQLYAAIGYSGHGLNLSSLHGRMLADCIAGGGDAWAWWPYLDRLPPYLPNEPLRWLGIRAALAVLG